MAQFRAADNRLFDSDEEILLQGYLLKQGQMNPAWKRRFFVLTNKCLYYFSQQPSCYSYDTVRGTISLLYITAVNLTKTFEATVHLSHNSEESATSERRENSPQRLVRKSNRLIEDFQIITPIRKYLFRIDKEDSEDSRGRDEHAKAVLSWVSAISSAAEKFCSQVNESQGPFSLRTLAAQGKKWMNVAISAKSVGMLPSPIKRVVFEARSYVFGSKGFERDSPAWVRTTSWLDSFKPCGVSWKEVAASHRSSPILQDPNTALEALVEIGVDQDTKEQIEKDLPRTFSTIEYFSDPDVVNSTRRVLTAVAVYLPEVSYVQGMNFIASYLFLHVKAEEDCLELLMDMMVLPKYNLQAVFREGTPNLTVYAQLIGKLVKDIQPKLFDHLHQLDLSSCFFSYQWILTLFTYSMPFDEIAKIWTLFFQFGWTAMFKAFLLLVLDLQDELMKGDFEECFAMLRDAPANVKTDFAERVSKFELKPRHLEAIQAAAYGHEEVLR